MNKKKSNIADSRLASRHQYGSVRTAAKQSLAPHLRHWVLDGVTVHEAGEYTVNPASVLVPLFLYKSNKRAARQTFASPVRKRGKHTSAAFSSTPKYTMLCTRSRSGPYYYVFFLPTVSRILIPAGPCSRCPSHHTVRS